SPLRFAASSVAMISAAAPSLTPEALPAVTVPSGRTIGFSIASASTDVSRGCSSRFTTTGSPLRWGISTALISESNRPLACAGAAQAVQGDTARFVRKPRQQPGHAREVAIVLARLVGAAEDDVVDLIPVDSGIARKQRL